jgi:carbamoylphosphate synthase large subunit
MTKAVKAPRAVRSIRISVSETNLRKAASRLLATKLVSTEIAFIQRELGASATQEDLDRKIVAVRAMPWASIALAE